MIEFKKRGSIRFCRYLDFDVFVSGGENPKITIDDGHGEVVLSVKGLPGDKSSKGDLVSQLVTVVCLHLDKVLHEEEEGETEVEED